METKTKASRVNYIYHYMRLRANQMMETKEKGGILSWECTSICVTVWLQFNVRPSIQRRKKQIRHSLCLSSILFGVKFHNETVYIRGTYRLKFSRISIICVKILFLNDRTRILLARVLWPLLPPPPSYSQMRQITVVLVGSGGIQKKTFVFKYEMVAGSFLHKAPGNTGNKGLACKPKKHINNKGRIRICMGPYLQMQILWGTISTTILDRIMESGSELMLFC
jgi:hypothetical protein